MPLQPAFWGGNWPSKAEKRGLGTMKLLSIRRFAWSDPTWQAFRLADTTAVLPFDFLKLVWAALLAFLVFGEVPTLWTWLGGCAAVRCGRCGVGPRKAFVLT